MGLPALKVLANLEECLMKWTPSKDNQNISFTLDFGHATSACDGAPCIDLFGSGELFLREKLLVTVHIDVARQVVPIAFYLLCPKFLAQM